MSMTSMLTMTVNITRTRCPFETRWNEQPLNGQRAWCKKLIE